MSIVEPDDGWYEPEYRFQFEAKNPVGPTVVVQGSVDVFYNEIKGNPDDDKSNEYEVRLLVGPYWRDVQAVVPSVTIDGFRNTNADEDDAQQWIIQNLTWDTIGEFGPNNDELRIRLKFEIIVRGEHSRIDRLGYYLMAHGRELGVGGINKPGPVKPQG